MPFQRLRGKKHFAGGGGQNGEKRDKVPTNETHKTNGPSKKRLSGNLREKWENVKREAKGNRQINEIKHILTIFE